MHWLSRYIADIDGIGKQGDATEPSYRTPIQTMLQAAAQEFGADVDILHEPGRAKQFGSPDFRVSAKGGGVVGYVECKAPGENLRKLITGEQMRKYRALSENIMLTDSYQWLHLRDGKLAGSAALTVKPGKAEREAAGELLRAFLTKPAESIGDSRRLAAALARRCAMLRDGLARHEDDEESRLPGLLEEFQKTLDHDLDFTRFIDVFAQTLVYSLLMARLNAPDGENLELDTVQRHIPESFAVIHQITSFLTDLKGKNYRKVHAVVDDILAIVNGMNKAAVAESMSYNGKDGKGVGDDGDPYLNFYEIFLSEYDAKLRENRGVYYTPTQVVKFIVRAANDLLKRDFGIPEGFADMEKVTALDFAAGTGTFMLEMARAMFGGEEKAKRDILARGHFLKNFYGFELMASAYVISHMKLSHFLSSNGIDLRDDERIQIYLTNTLEKVSAQIKLNMLPFLAREAKDAQKVKDSPVLVIVGNPPYSGHSQNKSTEKYEREHKKIKGKRVTDTRDTWIGGLLRGFDGVTEVGGGYYESDGVSLTKQGERTTKWIQDDYVKFIRFAQWKMDQVPRGIVAIITNHAFLDNPTFRGMRQSLMNTFDALYFLDLHGNAKKQERTPQGGKDKNVFAIQQGVAVSLLVKNPAVKERGVFHADMWGSRKDKFDACAQQSVGAIKWEKINPASPLYLFVPRDAKAAAKYENFYSVNDIFRVRGAGITTAHDAFVIDADEEALLKRFAAFQAAEGNAAQLHETFEVARKMGWDIMDGKNALKNEEDLRRFIQPICYRPFDTRHIFYEDNLVWRTVRGVMQHMLVGDNVGLTTVRQVKTGNTWQHCLATAQLTESTYVSNRTSEINSLFPLYCYDNEMGEAQRRENFTQGFRDWIDARYGEAHTPEDILGCIYACLHSPDYRKRYADFLRRDFPRISFPENNDEFKRLAAIGGELIAAHLLRENCSGEFGKLRGGGTSHKVEKVRHDGKDDGRLYFNNDEYFAVAPEVFNFQIGSYKPLDKFLKSRKGRKLSAAEIAAMEKSANAIAFTIKKTAEIDG